MNTFPAMLPDENLPHQTPDPNGPAALEPLNPPAVSPADLPADLSPDSLSDSIDSAAPSAPLLPEQDLQPQPSQPLLFQNWEQPLPRPPARIPHLGHLAILGTFALFGLIVATGAFFLALHFHLYGVQTKEQAIYDIHFTLGHEVLLYLITFVASILFFPLVWDRGFFAGIQWNGATAFRLRHRLFLAAILCFLLALLSTALMPGPKDAPIDKMFRSPGAAWLLFGFGVTIAPFFEELFFRGFFLPALCTACDWVNERIRHTAPPLLGPNGHPQWSLSAMIAGSIFTSLPFAALHAAQTGYSWGPLLLLVAVSLVLCAVRLVTRSLASSVLVHASYNFLLFSLMLLGSQGFQHLDKL